MALVQHFQLVLVTANRLFRIEIEDGASVRRPRFTIEVEDGCRSAQGAYRFDIFHAGMPYVRETAVIGKNFPNAWLNLCWSHIISPEMTCSLLDEWIDMVPSNKITGFGGDYSTHCFECVYGHLQMARENITRVLSARIDRGLLSMDDAEELARQWLYDNPKDLYWLYPKGQPVPIPGAT